MKPVIGITCVLEIKPKKQYSVISQNYINSLVLAGGIPLIIPHNSNSQVKEDMDIYLDKIDGLILSGGEDISPFLYGENPRREVTYITPARDAFELALVKKAVEKGIPVLGVCRGMHMINVALGGSLIQDINEQIKGSIEHMPINMPVNRVYHKIKIESHSILEKIFGQEELIVNSFHHQAVKEFGKGVVPTAFSEDGVVEAIEIQGINNILGVQCHPEDLTVDYPHFLKLFEYFVEISR